jgi:hypothetical protein
MLQTKWGKENYIINDKNNMAKKGILKLKKIKKEYERGRCPLSA